MHGPPDLPPSNQFAEFSLFAHCPLPRPHGGIHDPRHREHASHDGARRGEEGEQRPSLLLEPNLNGAEVIEKEDALHSDGNGDINTRITQM